MKFRLALLQLALWAPACHGAFHPVPRQHQQRLATHQSWSPLYLASNNATGDQEINPAVQQAAATPTPPSDLDPEALEQDLDTQLDDLTSLVQDFNAPKPATEEPPVKAYTPSAVQAYQEALQEIKEEEAQLKSSSNAGKGFGIPKATTAGNKKKKAAFMTKNKKGFAKKQDEIVDAASKAFDDLEKLNKEAASKPSPRDLIQEAKKKKQVEKTPTMSVFNPVAPPFLQKKKPTLKDKYAPPKKEVPSANMGMGATSTPAKEETKKEEPVAEKKTYFPTPTPPQNIQEDLAKTYFPPTPIQDKPKVPKVTKVTTTGSTTTTTPKETPVTPQEKTPTPPTTPVAGKTANPFVKPISSKDAVEKTNTPKKNIVNPFSQPVAKVTPVEQTTPKPAEAKVTPPKTTPPKPAEAKKETPIKKIFNPYGQKAFDADARDKPADLKDKPLDELLEDAAKATAPTEPTAKATAPTEPAAPKPAVDPVSKLGDAKIPVDTAKAASQIQDKIKVEASQKKMPKVELPKVELPKVELPKVELPKIALPKIEISQKAVDQAMEAAKDMSKVALEGVQTISKEGGDWALKVQSSLNTARVNQLDMTYEQAFQKMGKSGKGLIKMGSVLGGAIKDIYGILAESNQKSKPQSLPKAKAQPVPKAKATPKPTVVSKPKKEASYLDQLESKTVAPAPQAQTTAPSKFQRIFNFGDIKLPKPTMPKISTPEVVEPVAEVKVEEEKAPVVKATKTKAIKSEPAPLAKKTESFLGNFMKSASNAMKDAQSKTKEETEKLQAKVKEETESWQASIEELKKKTKRRDTIIYDGSKKTRAVDEKKNKGPLSFFDFDDK